MTALKYAQLIIKCHAKENGNETKWSVFPEYIDGLHYFRK